MLFHRRIACDRITVDIASNGTRSTQVQVGDDPPGRATTAKASTKRPPDPAAATRHHLDLARKFPLLSRRSVISQHQRGAAGGHVTARRRPNLNSRAYASRVCRDLRRSRLGHVA